MRPLEPFSATLADMSRYSLFTSDYVFHNVNDKLASLADEVAKGFPVPKIHQMFARKFRNLNSHSVTEVAREFVHFSYTIDKIFADP